MSVIVPTRVLEDARAFFEDQGAFGKEGTGMLAGRAGVDVVVTRFFIPDQTAGVFPGCYVEVTRLGKQQLATALPLEERWVARIHSHPGEAFHSPTDDANPGLTAGGAISIVVPYFGLGLRRGLEACNFHVMRRGQWVAVPFAELEFVLA